MLGLAMIDYQEKKVAGPLEPYLECVWLAWSASPLKTRQTQRVVPDACPELVIQLQDPFDRWVDEAWRTQPRVFLAGTLTAPWLLRPGLRVRTLGARFRPAAVRRFFAVDMKDAVDREVELPAVTDPLQMEDLLEALGPEADSSRLFERLEAFLASRLSDRLAADAGQSERLIDRAVGLVVAGKGRSTIRLLAAELGCHVRSLERAFAQDLGITPKLFARIVRLNAVLATFDEPERSNGVDLALEMGFFDQAHLLRDVRLLAGRRLSAPRADDGDVARHFTDPQRLRQLLRTAYQGP